MLDRGLPVLAVLALLGGMALAAGVETAEVGAAKDFDARWNFAQPDSTEAIFRTYLPAARAGSDVDYLAQLLTQIARTQGLQRQFAAAHATLDEVEPMLGDSLVVARVRYLLERGRVFNSSKHPDEARPLFREAWERGRVIGADVYAVDAAHMMAIVEPPDSALAWNKRAMALAEASPSPRAKKWLGSLYNNMGWTYHDQGDYQSALDMFEKALAFRITEGQPAETRIARWCVARTKRSLGEVPAALAMQEELKAEFDAIGEEDGYVYEELGECLLALGRKEEAVPNFARAYELLSKDPWLADSEPARIARLRDLGAGGAGGTGGTGGKQ
jgi:tetratricopeptide (TPR) repeat protein